MRHTSVRVYCQRAKACVRSGNRGKAPRYRAVKVHRRDEVNRELARNPVIASAEFYKLTDILPYVRDTRSKIAVYHHRILIAAAVSLYNLHHMISHQIEKAQSGQAIVEQRSEHLRMQPALRYLERFLAV